MLKTSAGINIRSVRKKDREKVISIVKATQFFRPNEILIAEEVFDDSVNKPNKDYFSFIAEMNGNVAGWICFGPVPCTIGAYDIYWIVIDPATWTCQVISKFFGRNDKKTRRAADSNRNFGQQPLFNNAKVL